VSIARARVKKGITTSAHHLEGVDEIYLITKGNAQVDVGDVAPTVVTAGDVVFIPAGVSQRILTLEEPTSCFTVYARLDSLKNAIVTTAPRNESDAANLDES